MQMDELKQKLLTEKQRIEEALGSVSHKDEGEHVPGDYEAAFPDYGDDKATELEDNSPNEVADFQRNLSVTSDLGQELVRINEALQRIEGGTYGTCGKCGNGIAPERLEVYPAAKVCIDCASKQK